MSGWSAVLSTDRVAVGEREIVFTPRATFSGSRGVMLCHGAGGDCTHFADPTNLPGMHRLAHTLASVGVPVLAADFGDDPWGNSVGLARLDTGWSLLQDMGCATDRVVLVGVSMGALNCLNWTRANPYQVAALIGVMPVSDLQDMRSTFWDDSIETAWAIGDTDPLPALANPTDDANAARIAKCPGPKYLYYSSGDEIITPSTVTTLASKIGATATVVSSAVHSDAPVAALPFSDITTIVRDAA